MLPLANSLKSGKSGRGGIPASCPSGSSALRRGVFERKRAAPVFVAGWRSRESLSAARRGDYPNGYCGSEDHPVVLVRHSLQQAGVDPSNVRRVKAGVSIEELAEDIARRTLLQESSPAGPRRRRRRDRHVRDPAGGRRYRALELLVKRSAWPRPRLSHASSAIRAPRSSVRMTRSPRTSSARRSIRSTSSGPSRPCVRRAAPRRTLPPRSLPASTS